MRIVFMGTPDFAVPSLRALLDAGYEVVGAFTQPDRPAGRGKKLAACPVKVLAQSRGVPVYQFEKIRRREGREALEALKPDLCVTAAFGQILSQRILDIPPLGTVNVHASILPKHRGAAPINWCILAGDRITGVTTMFTDAGLDTGDIALIRETEIGPEETAGALTERLSILGAELLVETIRAIERGTCPRVKQDEAMASYEPMLSRETAKIDWTRSAREIDCFARGLNPWPTAFTTLGDAVIKVHGARVSDMDAAGAKPGTVLCADPKRGLVVACGDGAVEIVNLQAPNAKAMSAKAYLMGKLIPCGECLGDGE